MKKKERESIFPVTEKISYCGVSKEFSVNNGDLLTCIRCGKQFYASGGNVIKNASTGNTYISCPKCEYKGSSFYYTQQREGKVVVG